MTKTKMALAIMGILGIGIGTMQQSEAVEATEIKKAMEIKEAMTERSSLVSGTSEVIRTPFDTTFVSTTEKYEGLILISVSGDGESLSTYQNDAFYVFENAQGNQTTPIQSQQILPVISKYRLVV